MPTIYMLIGLPASGKSTIAKKYAARYNAKIFSSDELRKELFGDVNCQTKNHDLFCELQNRIKMCLHNGDNVIYDATNINYRKRIAFLEYIQKINCKKVAVLMATPYSVCLARNEGRERKVPESVIENMYKNFTLPYWYEGWDDIEIIWADNAKNSIGSVSNWVNNVISFNQNNPHHRLSLGEHCKLCSEIASGFNSKQINELHRKDFESAAFIHDCGKPFCQDFKNSKGVETEKAHYYSHHHVGAYNSLFFSDINDHLYVAQLIQWHMHPYRSWSISERAEKRDFLLLGEELFSEINLLHQADLLAH